MSSVPQIGTNIIVEATREFDEKRMHVQTVQLKIQ